METTGTIPKGTDLLATLIDLLADQEGVKVKYVIKERNEDEKVQN
jgi:hypothetical protein